MNLKNILFILMLIQCPLYAATVVLVPENHSAQESKIRKEWIKKYVKQSAGSSAVGFEGKIWEQKDQISNMLEFGIESSLEYQISIHFAGVLGVCNEVPSRVLNSEHNLFPTLSERLFNEGYRILLYGIENFDLSKVTWNDLQNGEERLPYQLKQIFDGINNEINDDNGLSNSRARNPFVQRAVNSPQYRNKKNICDLYKRFLNGNVEQHTEFRIFSKIDFTLEYSPETLESFFWSFQHQYRNKRFEENIREANRLLGENIRYIFVVVGAGHVKDLYDKLNSRGASVKVDNDFLNDGWANPKHDTFSKGVTGQQINLTSELIQFLEESEDAQISLIKIN